MSKLDRFKLFDKEVNVLIVEDETILANTMKKSLEKMGYLVSGIEATAKQAILHVQNKMPDIVIIDINLHCSSGIDAANEIWQKYKIPIIFLTSYSYDRTMNKTMQCKPYAYLIKPCKSKELKAAIKMTLHKHKYFFSPKKSLNIQKSDFIYIDENLKFDRIKLQLYKKGKRVNLTKNEKRLFEILSQKQNEVISYEQISNFIWRENLYDKAKLRMLIYRLRQKLDSDSLLSFYELGYKLKVMKKVA